MGTTKALGLVERGSNMIADEMIYQLQKKTVTSTRPKVAILTNYPYDGTTFTGGVETATAGLLEGLAKYVGDFDFHILALSRDIRNHVIEQREGITFHFLAITTSWYARPHVIPNIVNARAELKKLDADLVHCQDNMALAIGGIIAQAARKLFTVHGIKSVESGVWEGQEYWSHQMDALLERWVRRRFDEVITISPYVDRFLPIHVRKHHITNPVRNIFFEQPQSGVNTHRILFVGVLTRLKRPMDVLKAFAIVRKMYADATLSMVGVPEDARYERELKQYILDAKLGGIELLGARTQEQVAALMRTSTVLVLASAQENTPMVIAEAMASGLPVIASRVGGVPAMVKDGVNGLLFECEHVNQIADHIMRVFEDDELRSRLSSAGRAKAISEYSSDAVASATVQVYRKMLGA